LKKKVLDVSENHCPQEKKEKKTAGRWSKEQRERPPEVDALACARNPREGGRYRRSRKENPVKLRSKSSVAASSGSHGTVPKKREDPQEVKGAWIILRSMVSSRPISFSQNEGGKPSSPVGASSGKKSCPPTKGGGCF